MYSTTVDCDQDKTSVTVVDDDIIFTEPQNEIPSKDLRIKSQKQVSSKDPQKELLQELEDSTNTVKRLTFLY